MGSCMYLCVSVKLLPESDVFSWCFRVHHVTVDRDRCVLYRDAVLTIT